MRKSAIGIRTPKDLLGRLQVAWRADTSAIPGRWSPGVPSFGQCAVTALIVQDLFGGELRRSLIAGGSHYWNRLPSGEEIDLTSDQFEVYPALSNVEARSRDYVLSFPSTNARYRQLLSNLGL
ncbi:MAG TPA: hypothetical protein VNX26_05935 [Candidatus Acidoferrum sp.]|jgi:hypothetical protein|nr:hypothetical protein [Candidatus Acidoferrum sp.]